MESVKLSFYLGVMPWRHQKAEVQFREFFNKALEAVE
jgi:hypothetical protein